MTYLKKTTLILMIIILSGSIPDIVFSEKWHPLNKKLRMMDPKNPIRFKWPSVPRVTGEQAFYLYKTGKAIFFHIGVDGPNIKGGIKMTQKQAAKANKNKLKKIGKNKIIVTY